MMTSWSHEFVRIHERLYNLETKKNASKTSTLHPLRVSYCCNVSMNTSLFNLHRNHVNENLLVLVCYRHSMLPAATTRPCELCWLLHRIGQIKLRNISLLFHDILSQHLCFRLFYWILDFLLSDKTIKPASRKADFSNVRSFTIGLITSLNQTLRSIQLES